MIFVKPAVHSRVVIHNLAADGRISARRRDDANMPLPSVITAAQAHSLGFTRHAVAHKIHRGHWRILLRGVYLTHGGAPAEPDWLRAAALWGGPDAVISGAAGLRMRRIATPRTEGILTLVPHDRRAHSSGPVRIRRTTRLPDRPQLRGGIRTAAVPRCIVDAARDLRSLGDTRTILAAVVQTGWCTVGEIAEELAVAGRSGTALLRRALTEIAAGAESAAECDAAEILMGAGIRDFEQNVEIRDHDGTLLARADFLWRGLRAILEIDGRDWHLNPTAWERTVRRHSALEVVGYSVLHYTPSAMRQDPRRFVSDVRRWLDCRRALLRA